MPSGRGTAARPPRPPGAGAEAVKRLLVWSWVFIVAIGLVAGLYLAFTPPIAAGSAAANCTGTSLGTGLDDGNVARTSHRTVVSVGSTTPQCFRAARNQLKLAAAIGVLPVVCTVLGVWISRSQRSVDRVR